LCYKERCDEKRAQYQEEIAEIPIERRIYVDESGTNKSGYRTHGRALRGVRIHGIITGKRVKRVNVVAGFCDGKILADYCYEGTMNSRRFEDWFCGHLLPNTRKGDVIVMDNASYHNKKRLRKYAWVYKVKIIFLPPYSPDFNPIEPIWANLKRFLRNYGNRFSSIEYGICWYFSVAFY
jgi:transposase